MDEKEIIEYPVILIEEENGCLAIIPDIDGGVQGIEKEDTLQTAAEYIGEEIIDSGKIPEPNSKFFKAENLKKWPSSWGRESESERKRARRVASELREREVFYVEVDTKKYKYLHERIKIRQASAHLMEKNKEVYRRLSER